MAVSASRITVTTSPTALSAGAEADFTPGRNLVLFNPGPTTIYLGGADVTTSAGFELPGGSTFSADLGRGDALHGVVSSGTQEVHVLQSGV